MTRSHAPLLEVEGVRLIREGRHILDGVSLEIGPGEIHALLGANGSGKSSLAYAIMGCRGYRPDSGRVRFAGKTIDDLPLYQRARLGITLAWQEPARFEGVSIRDYLQSAGSDVDVAGSLRRVGLAPEQYADRLADAHLSGGERKRVELAAVLAVRPRLAILDEPTAGIDLQSIQVLTGAIEGLKAEGGSVLLITHQAELARHADRASRLCGGLILESGTPDQVISRYGQQACHRCNGERCRE